MIKKLLVKKEHKEYIEELNKDVIISEGKIFFIEDISRDYHCADGVFSKQDLQKQDTIVRSSKGKEYYILNANFMDSYKGIKKLAQTIPLKDIGFIIAETGIGKDSIVVDTGSGSGGSACFIARHVRHVYSYDINSANIEQTRKNAEYFGITNITIENENAYENIPAKDVDMIVLDLPEVWRAIDPADKALKVGGYIVAYCPQVTQAQRFINELAKKGNYIHIKTVEMVERDWKVQGEVVRPRSLSNIHSAFLTFVRKIN